MNFIWRGLRLTGYKNVLCLLPWPETSTGCGSRPAGWAWTLPGQTLPEALLVLWLIKYLLSGQKLVTAALRFVEKLSAALQLLRLLQAAPAAAAQVAVADKLKRCPLTFKKQFPPDSCLAPYIYIYYIYYILAWCVCKSSVSGASCAVLQFAACQWESTLRGWLTF